MAGDDEELSLGESLRRLRRSHGLSGHDLARQVGVSQAKISRLETGVGAALAEDVRRIAIELRASPDEVDRLVDLAERTHDRMTDWRSPRGAVATIQREVERLEAATRIFRVFQPAVVVGLAQTSEYMRAILSATHGIRSSVAIEGGVTAVPEAVSVRVRRQTVLAEPDREFQFVMTESVLSNRFGRPEDMPAQIHRLREIAAYDNVSMRIIPADAALPFPPYHGFELLDDQCVIVDVFNTLVTSRGRSDVAVYRLLFDRLAEAATDDIAPILDRYFDFYLEQSRTHRD